MNSTPDSRPRWNYPAVIIAVVLSSALQYIIWAGLRDETMAVVKMAFAGGINLLVLLRLPIALLRRERSRCWILYVILPLVAIPLAELIFTLLVRAR